MTMNRLGRAASGEGAFRWMRRSALTAGSVLALLFASFSQGADPPGSMVGMDMPGMHTPTGPTGQPAVPVKSAHAMPADHAEVRVSPEVQQRIGVTLGRVERSSLGTSIRTVGILQPDEARIAHIHVKTEGWVEKLHVAFTGQKVRAGEPLLSIYSPALFAAQSELLAAVRASKAGGDQAADGALLVQTARRRLEFWDVPPSEIARLEQSGQPLKALTLRSPISGTVLSKQAFEGQYVMPQNDLYVVADLTVLWVQAKVFQDDLPGVVVGMPATVTLSSLPGKRIAGRVAFVDPVIDDTSRSAQVRIELPNTAGRLKPGMFADVTLSRAEGSGLTVPASAVIRTGERNIVFRAVGSDRYVPVEVKIGDTRFGDRFEVLRGLNAGDQVVTSGNFLIDSESRLEAGDNSMAGMPGMEGTSGGAPQAATRP